MQPQMSCGHSCAADPGQLDWLKVDTTGVETRKRINEMILV